MEHWFIALQKKPEWLALDSDLKAVLLEICEQIERYWKASIEAAHEASLPRRIG